MSAASIDLEYVKGTLRELLDIPSPAGFTDEVVRYACEQLDAMGIRYELTRRGSIRANLRGKIRSPDRAIVAHLDTLGAMVKDLKPNGRCSVVPVGTWSSRFAEGARVTVFTDDRPLRGTVLPLKASGHVYDSEIDTLPVSWDNVEIRLDENCGDLGALRDRGVAVGDFVAFDPNLDITDNGFINARHLDDKAGVAVLLACARLIREKKLALPVDCHLLFTISEEVGSGASAVLHGDVAEMVTIDSGPVAPEQRGTEYAVTVCMQDSAGPFDYHLTRKLIGLAERNAIPYRRDVFKHYRCDSASAIEAGNDIRTALVCFGADATHGYERCHVDTLQALGSLLLAYMQSDPTFARDKQELGPLQGFPHMPIREGKAD